MLLLYDCDGGTSAENKGEKIFKQCIPKMEDNPLSKGIENLFDKTTLEKAIQFKSAFIDITSEHQKKERGKRITIHEKWEINKNEKPNLCNWFCENGTPEDFKNFQKIFDLLKEILIDEEKAATYEETSPTLANKTGDISPHH